jgi:hypothetical protein
MISMNTQLVNQAVELFVETLPLEGINASHPEFHHLYSQECKLYGVMRLMGEGELGEYRNRVQAIASEGEFIF